MIQNGKVNQKVVIKITPPTYFHCFKLSESEYVVFDIKMDMPLVRGSLAIIKTIQLPQNSVVFFYDFNHNGYFEKGPSKTIKVEGDGKHTKPPLRFKLIDNKILFYHHFKLSPVLSVLFDEEFDMPVAYGSNQRIQAVLSKIPSRATIFYYKEDASVKNSFKKFMIYEGKKEPKK